MNERQGTDQDDLLDRMLAAYGEVEPPVGLETRVLGEINRTLTRRHRRVWLVFAGPAVATAAALFLFFSRQVDPPNAMQISNVDSARTREIEQAISRNPATGASAQVQLKHQSSVLKVKSAREGVAKARQSTFPSPSAPSDQERALLSLMRSDGGALVASALFPSGTNVDGLKSKFDYSGDLISDRPGFPK